MLCFCPAATISSAEARHCVSAQELIGRKVCQVKLCNQKGYFSICIGLLNRDRSALCRSSTPKLEDGSQVKVKGKKVTSRFGGWGLKKKLEQTFAPGAPVIVRGRALSKTGRPRTCAATPHSLCGLGCNKQEFFLAHCSRLSPCMVRRRLRAQHVSSHLLKQHRAL